MSDRRANKRWRREHRQKQTTRKPPKPPAVELVYTPKNSAEAARRTMRAAAFVGKPFLRLARYLSGDVLFTAKDGTQVTTQMVEMVYNDMLLMDAISDGGADGPLYKATVSGTQLEILEYAMEAYAGAMWPE